MDHYLKEYNNVSKAPMPLVMFRYATEHCSRINRIIKQRGGHALLVGVGGSGRQSLAKLATYIANYDLFQIEVNKTYDINSFRNDLKKVLKVAGAECKNVVFSSIFRFSSAYFAILMDKKLTLNLKKRSFTTKWKV